ncbi:MAG: hypothetical protein JSV19_08195 [Phycisphaerales bacterium]|nr:MAG: hypothetical protein JSV19_08195 [Phycisphaerales bacterium]
MKIYALEHADPKDVASLLSHSLQLKTVASDESSRSVIVTAPERMIARVEELIAAIDVPPRTPAAKELAEEMWTKVYALKHADSDNVANLLSHSLRLRTVASDKSSRSVVVTAPKRLSAEVERLLEALDVRPPAPKKALSLRLELFFLQARLHAGEKVAPELAEVLKPVASALAESGIQQPVLLAPLVVQVGSDEEFTQEGLVAQADGIILIDVKGEAERGEADETVKLELRARMKGPIRTGNQVQYQSVFELNTTLTFALGDYVVLAAAPGQTDYGDVIALVVRVTPSQ